MVNIYAGHSRDLEQISLPDMSDDDDYSLPMNEIHVSDQDSLSDVGGSYVAGTTHSVEDQLLSELLHEVGRSKKEAKKESQQRYFHQESLHTDRHPRKNAPPSDGTLETCESGRYSDEEPQLEREVIVCPSRDYDEEESDNEESVESSVDSSTSSDGTGSLLERAHERIAMQHLQDEVKRLVQVVEQKNDEIKELSGQLRQAIETKCDLVIAHTELERHHEFNLSCKSKDVTVLKEENRNLHETRTKVELSLLNDLVQLTDSMKEAEKNHQQELDDWERLHRNEMLEKDFQIAQLIEEIRSLQSLRSIPHRAGLEALFGTG